MTGDGGDERPYPVPLVTAWTVATLRVRALDLTAPEIEAILNAAKLMEEEVPYYLNELILAKMAYIEAASSRAEAEIRQKEIDSGAQGTWEVYSAAKDAADRGPAWPRAWEIARVVEDVAMALHLRNNLTDLDFARCVWPVVSVIGEPTRSLTPSLTPSSSAGCLGTLVLSTVLLCWVRRLWR